MLFFVSRNFQLYFNSCSLTLFFVSRNFLLFFNVFPAWFLLGHIYKSTWSWNRSVVLSGIKDNEIKTVFNRRLNEMERTGFLMVFRMICLDKGLSLQNLILLVNWKVIYKFCLGVLHVYKVLDLLHVPLFKWKSKRKNFIDCMHSSDSRI